jgi:hypothetical protein
VKLHIITSFCNRDIVVTIWHKGLKFPPLL